MGHGIAILIHALFVIVVWPSYINCYAVPQFNQIKSKSCNICENFQSLTLNSYSVNSGIDKYDTDVWSVIKDEWKRQSDGINLIASENYASKAVLQALGSCMTNKYSEGLPGARYYGGNEFIDKIENICRERALKLFSLNSSEWAVNVQPYSGSTANLAVYLALLKPHDRLMGLDLPSGGHLTHGYQTLKRKISATSIFYESMPYHVNPDSGYIDYDELESLATNYKPKLIIAGASAYPRDWDYARMRRIADKVGAYLMADIAHISGIVVAKQCNNPFEFCDVVTSTTHKSLRGPRSGLIFSRKSFEDAINNAVFPSLQGGPHNNQIAAVAVALKEASEENFINYIKQVKKNAKALALALANYGYNIVTNGTDNHLILWDARSTGVSGAKLEKILEACSVYVNKNTIIGDVSAMNPGGIRLGTIAVTTRNMDEKHMDFIASIIHRATTLASIIQSSVPGDSKRLIDFVYEMEESLFQLELKSIREDVESFMKSFPLPGLNPNELDQKE